MSFAVPQFLLGLTAHPRDPISSIVWTDVSPRIEDMRVARGRRHWADQEAPGNGSFTFNNRDNRFDPTNSASPYFPNLLPVRRFRVVMNWLGTPTPIHTGFARTFPVQRPSVATSNLQVETWDILGWLRMAQVPGGTVVPQETTGARVARLLNLAGIPSSDYAYDTGSGVMPAATLTKASYLSYLQAAELAEGGRLFVNGSGIVRFLSRSTRLANAYTAAVFGNGGPAHGELPYRDPIGYGSAEEDLFNEITGTPTGGAEQVVNDSASDGEYGTRTLPMGTIDLNSTPQVTDRIGYELARHKDATVRVSELLIAPSDQPAEMWPLAISDIELDTRITVHVRAGGSLIFDEDGLVEGLEHTWQPGGVFTTRYSLSMADALRYWILGTSTLGVDTRLGY